MKKIVEFAQIFCPPPNMNAKLQKRNQKAKDNVFFEEKLAKIPLIKSVGGKLASNKEARRTKMLKCRAKIGVKFSELLAKARRRIWTNY